MGLLVRVLQLVALLAFGGCGGDDGPGSSGAESAATPTVAESSYGEIDIGGRSLYYRCEGAAVGGQPTILLLAGGTLGHDSWSPMQQDYAERGHHVCSYDRAGVAGSDPAPEARRTSEDTVDDLLALTAALELEPPFVVVAHSAGALDAALLAEREPGLLAGVVLVDPLGPHLDDKARAALPPERQGESDALAEERHFLTVISYDPSQNPEHLAIADSGLLAATAIDRPGPLFGDVPMVVLQAPSPELPGLPADYVEALHAAIDADAQQYAHESTSGTLVRVDDTGHMVMLDQPASVMQAIDEVLGR